MVTVPSSRCTKMVVLGGAFISNVSVIEHLKNQFKGKKGVIGAYGLRVQSMVTRRAQ